MAEKSDANRGATQLAELSIGGMTCSACTSAVTSALENIKGVMSVNVSLITERATIKYSKVEPSSLVAAIDDAGFDAQLLNVKEVNENRKLQIAIDGMTCSSCTDAVTQALERLDSVESVSVSLATDIATLTYSTRDSSFPVQAKEAIEDVGFEAKILSESIDRSDFNGVDSQNDSTEGVGKMSRLDLKIFGMPNSETFDHLEQVLKSIDGVQSVGMSRITHTAIIEYDQSKTGIRALIKCVRNQDCTAIVASSADNTQQLEALKRVKVLRRYKRDTIFAFILGIPCILLLKLRKILPSFVTSKVGRGIWVDDILGILMVLPILLGPARGFYSKSYKALRSRAPSMDVLVTASVTCAFAYSVLSLVYAIYSNLEYHQMYLWDACAMILMFVLLGKYLENLARGHTSKALSELISLVPEEALIIAPDTGENGELLPTDLLQVGDTVLLRPGERVSADGIVTSGESYISESLITGESQLVRKVVGDSVIGGTINGTGTLRFRVTSCGTDTKLAQIVAFIKDAQNSKAPIQRYADYAASRFVPVIMALAFLTFFIWFSAGCLLGKESLPGMFQHGSLLFMCLRLGISVVVVACPCALGLATPTAVMVGTGVGAEHGILVKGGGIFEVGAYSSVVLFDKTGTLTTGKMSISRTTVPAKYWPKIRALEMNSEHPAGKAISSYFHPDEVLPNDNLEWNKKKMNPKNITIFPGEGINGQIGDETIFVGRKSEAISDIQVIINDEVVGTIRLQDSLRSDAPAVVEMLKLQGKIVGIVSGDGKSAVDAIAKTLEIDEQYTWNSMKPEDKVNVIKRLQAEGHEVVFVGDGINDTPALVSSSLGISLEGSTHVAVESADIVLTQSSPIAAVPAALELCRATLRRIKINLLASVIYNVLMVPFAMGILLPFHLALSPIMASAAMACSSVSVVLSSLLLMRWKPKPLIYDANVRNSRPHARLLSFLRSLYRSGNDYESIQTS